MMQLHGVRMWDSACTLGCSLSTARARRSCGVMLYVMLTATFREPSRPSHITCVWHCCDACSRSVAVAALWR